MQVKIINNTNTQKLPEYQTDGSAGMDLIANITTPIELGPLERILIPTGICIQLPAGYEAQIRPRSGTAIKYGISVINSPGTVDSDYTGEIKVGIVNISNQSYLIQPNERIAQMIIAKHERITWEQVDILEETARGSGGFGHTGKV